MATGGRYAQYGHGPYMQKLEKMLDAGEMRLMLDINELRAEAPDLARGCARPLSVLFVLPHHTRMCHGFVE
jgi:hypothetical protein